MAALLLRSIAAAAFLTIILQAFACGRSEKAVGGPGVMLPTQSFTVVHEGRGAGLGGVIRNGRLTSSTDWLELSPGIDSQAVYESQWIPSGTRGVHALPSWNMRVPTGACTLVDLRVRAWNSGDVSPWYRIGYAGDAPPRHSLAGLLRTWPPLRDGPRDTGPVVHIDYLEVPEGFSEVQYRLTAIRTGNDGAGPVRVRRVALCITAIKDHPATLNDQVLQDICLSVPFRSQKTDDPSLAGRLCSPSCVAMLLAYHGLDVPVGEVAGAAFDPDHDIYGNWPRNIQAAADLGAGGFVTRFNSWSEVVAVLQCGQPIIASIRAANGELRGAPYSETTGHLIVLRGIDSSGNILVSDPAASNPGDGERTYQRDDLTTVWLRRGSGTAYVILPPDPVR
ncbi:MAG: C39 family peptidase [Phycisphaerae bacterium]|nr:C39 family peptidase [Phycisphaerae bacterium]